MPDPTVQEISNPGYEALIREQRTEIERLREENVDLRDEIGDMTLKVIELEEELEELRRRPVTDRWCRICGAQVRDETAWVDYDRVRMWFCPLHKPVQISTYPNGCVDLVTVHGTTHVLRGQAGGKPANDDLKPI